MNRCLFVFLCALALLAVSCGGIQVSPNPNNPIRSVAVLPIYNATNDVDGPRMVRALMEERIRNFHYRSVPLTDVDRTLRDLMGITLGAQLSLTTSEKLGEELGVDAVLYGYLLNFETVTIGIYNANKVRAGFKLIDTKTGAVIWSRGLGIKSNIQSGGGGSIGSAKAEDVELYTTIPGLEGIPGVDNWETLSSLEVQSFAQAAVLSLGEHLVTSVAGTHLKKETNALLDRIITNLPAGPGASQ